MAFGSPGGLDDSNVNAWTAKTNTGRQKTGYVANAVSSIGCRDAVGNVTEWLNEFITRSEHSMISGTGTFSYSDGGRANQPYTDGNGHYHATNDGVWSWDKVSPFGDGNGNIYEYNDFSLIAMICGGFWNSGTFAGIRAVQMNAYPWIIATNFGTRCACNSL